MVEYFFTCCHAAEAEYWAWRMAQTFFVSVRKVRSKGPLALGLLSSSDESASTCRSGTRKINSELMEVYSESGSPKAWSSTARDRSSMFQMTEERGTPVTPRTRDKLVLVLLRVLVAKARSRVAGG